MANANPLLVLLLLLLLLLWVDCLRSIPVRLRAQCGPTRPKVTVGTVVKELIPLWELEAAVDVQLHVVADKRSDGHKLSIVH